MVVAVSLLLVLMLVALWYRTASQPRIDGTIRIAGLTAAVDIVRDAEGIPHIYAQSTDDAYFALGFVHAQDRLWQLELNRRIPAGRMAETLGPNAAGTDRFLRTLGVRRNAERILEHLSADSRAVLEAYARGVNAYLANRSGPLPPEFLLTRAPAPEPWQPVDSISWQTMMAWDLGANWTQELLRMRLAQRLPLQRINQFLAPYPGDPVLETRDYTLLYRELAGTAEQLAQVARMAPPSLVDGMGSNNWVVGGALSKTGKPLLANDPHLGLSAPGLWYFAHLSAPGLNVIGATMPGLPVVVLGRNDHVAWGFTNTAPDVQDLYIERINPDKRYQYRTPDGWTDFQVRKEVIKVKGEDDIVLDVRETRHGPVVTGVLPVVGKTGLDAEEHVVSFAWTALRPDDLTLQAGIKFNRARNWQEFLDGARDFGSPQQSIVYADIEGNVGFVAPGRIPIRKPENDIKGLAPVPGWDARYDWAGFIPFDELPRSFNPATQRIMTANQKIVDSDYPHFLTSEWTPPYRAQRIDALLDAQAKHDLDSFAQIQQDIVSLAAREILPVLTDVHPKSARADAALATLKQWDGAMRADAVAPLLFNAWMRMAARHIFADELGDTLMNDYAEQRNTHLSTVNVLLDRDGQGEWCGNVMAQANSKPALRDCNQVLSSALEEALDDLERRYGKDMTQWRWGEAHAARAEHRPFGKVDALARFFDLHVPTPGDTFTVNTGRHNPRDEEAPFENRHAAGLRALYDLADLENSRFIHSTGQSGNLLSPLYDSYLQRWANGSYLPMKTRRDEVEKGRLGVLILTP